MHYIINKYQNPAKITCNLESKNNHVNQLGNTMPKKKNHVLYHMIIGKLIRSNYQLWN